MKNHILVSTALAGCALAAAAMLAHARQAQTAAAAATNLKVLPATLSKDDVRLLMKEYERDLGVSCSYCHVEDRDSSVIDYVSDDNPRKHTARLMIAMLEDINGKHLAQLGGDRRYSLPVTCGSCHQGRSSPPEFLP